MEKDIENVLVTGIISTYKRPVEIVKRATQSIVNQTHKNMEIIIVNDCPEDTNLVKQIKSMLDDFKDRRIKYIVHEKNMGACAARNTGIKNASGEYVSFLDDDDEWFENKIEEQLLGFENEKIGMVYSPFYNVTDTLPGKLTVLGTKSGNLLKEILWINCIGGTSVPMIRKSVFDSCGMFDEELLSSQDYDMWLRIAQKYEINYIDKPLLNRFEQRDSITSNMAKQQQGFELFNKKHFELYKNDLKALNYRYSRSSKQLIEKGYFKEAFIDWKKALKTKKLAIRNFTEPCKGIIKFFIKKFN